MALTPALSHLEIRICYSQERPPLRKVFCHKNPLQGGRAMCEGFASAVRSLKRGELALSSLVSRDNVEAACEEEGYSSRASLYTPITTILTFLAQLIGADGSCQQAVNGLIADRTSKGKSRCSADTGGYCKARSRLPEKVFWRLAQQSGQTAENQADDTLHWQGHRVRVADGSTLKIADTPANRQQYPLQKNLKPGLHYPVVRILVVFSLAVGTVLDAAICPYQGKGTGETAMLRAMASLFDRGDILLVDRYYSGYWDIAFWLARGVHMVSVISVSRKVDFRKGNRLGKMDHVVQWKKTPRPDWIDKATAQKVPRTISIRELRVKVEARGFRVRHVLVVTTLTDVDTYTKQSLGDLYRLRWQAELQLRSLKAHMGMEQLRCKTPEMVRKEFATYLLAYNCVRRVGLEAAQTGNLKPYEISFKHTMQAINEFMPRLWNTRDVDQWFYALLITVSEIQVANRPDRIEPYCCKKRPKDYPPTKQTRSAYKRLKIRRK